jgi:hypothetical protein
MKIIFITLFFFSSVNLLAADSLWKKIKVDENLSVLFPTISTRIDTFMEKNGYKFQFKVLKAETDNASLGLTMSANETKINVDNEESLREALNGIADGACENVRKSGMDCHISDSIISKLHCKIVKIVNPEMGSSSLFLNYFFLVNDKLYAFTINSGPFILDSSAFHTDVNNLVNGIHFNTTGIKEKSFGSKAESLGYKFGKVIGFLLPFALIIGLIIYFVSRKKN